MDRLKVSENFQLTSRDYNEVFSRLVSKLLTNLPTSEVSSEECRWVVKIAHQLLNLHKNDKRLIHLISEIGPIYKTESEKYIGKSAYFHIERLVSIHLLTSTNPQKNKICQIKERNFRVRGLSPGLGEYQIQRRKYYNINTIFRNLFQERPEIKDIVLGNSEDLGKAFLSLVGEQKAQLNSIIRQIKARERHDEEQRQREEQELKGAEKQENELREKRRELIANFDQEISKCKSWEEREALILQEQMDDNKKDKDYRKYLHEQYKRLKPKSGED